MALSLARLMAPVIFATGLGLAALTPTQARASDDLVRVIVDVADVIYHSGQPYYRHGPGYGYGDRLIVVRDRYHRPTYYRYVPRHVVYRAPPRPRGHAYGYYRNAPVVVRYVDRDRHDYYHHDRRDRYDRDDRWDDDRRWKQRDKHRRGGRGRD